MVCCFSTSAPIVPVSNAPAAAPKVERLTEEQRRQLDYKIIESFFRMLAHWLDHSTEYDTDVERELRHFVELARDAKVPHGEKELVKNCLNGQIQTAVTQAQAILQKGHGEIALNPTRHFLADLVGVTYPKEPQKIHKVVAASICTVM